MLFERGTATPNASFVSVMDKIKGVTTGLKDADIKLLSGLFVQAVPDGSQASAQNVANQRLDIVRNKMLASLEDNSVTIKGSTSVKEKRGEVDPAKLIGFIRIKIAQKEIKSDGSKPRKLETLYGNARVDMSVYDSFVHQLADRKKKAAPEKAKTGKALKQQVDQELNESIAPAPVSPIETE
ncbi:hypothetical protein D3C72_1634220 [compost metagenome]